MCEKDRCLLDNSSQCKLEYNNLGYLKKFPNALNRNLKFCLNSKCKFGEYRCNIYEICIDVENICDGIKHCPMQDDEENCG